MLHQRDILMKSCNGSPPEARGLRFSQVPGLSITSQPATDWSHRQTERQKWKIWIFSFITGCKCLIALSRLRLSPWQNWYQIWQQRSHLISWLCYITLHLCAWIYKHELTCVFFVFCFTSNASWLIGISWQRCLSIRNLWQVGRLSLGRMVK